MRVYVPLTLPGLAEAYRTGELGGARVTAYAVTPALSDWYESEDSEELEYAALGLAAYASLRLLAADPSAPRRRVVVAVDVADRAVDLSPGEMGETLVPGPLRLARAAAVHVDAEDAGQDVTAAAAALDAADKDDAEALDTVDRAAGHDLLWFATQEVPALIGGGAGGEDRRDGEGGPA
ncbi:MULTISPECIES: DUF6912 family protein [Streptomyces]|uniref:Uncharacterized protein n=1 Tax=Streptomyces chilikensis TaxID=1194079 RepID=A0ABV3EXX9_9ACTN|nr:hypothetical protein [Streptomyces sp. MJP52]MDH6226662.1 hypothetical protein [Streptomyces sp. MJP52]